MKPLFAIALIVSSLTTTSHAADLTVVSWNIANLAAPGQALRGYDRTDNEYDELKKQIEEMNADVVAFQEIGSIKGLEAILPKAYTYQFESRCYVNKHQCKDDADDIYTAIAIKSDISHSFFQINQLAIEHQNECGDTPRKVRGAVGVDVTINGTRYLIPSLHVKATCKDNSVEDGTADDCATQREQISRLRKWMDSQPEDTAIILAGDFNRKLLEPSDKIRKEFFSSLTDGSFLPNKSTRACWADFDFKFSDLAAQARKNNSKFDTEGATPWMFTPKSNHEIDFFVLEGVPSGKNISAEQLRMSGTYAFRDPGHALEQCDGSLRKFSEEDNRVLTFAEAYPSDHCPIFLSIGE